MTSAPAGMPANYPSWPEASARPPGGQPLAPNAGLGSPCASARPGAGLDAPSAGERPGGEPGLPSASERPGGEPRLLSWTGSATLAAPAVQIGRPEGPALQEPNANWMGRPWSAHRTMTPAGRAALGSGEQDELGALEGWLGSPRSSSGNLCLFPDHGFGPPPVGRR